MTHSIVPLSDILTDVCVVQKNCELTSIACPAPSDQFRSLLYCPLQVDCRRVGAEQQMFSFHHHLTSQQVSLFA